MSKKVQDRLIEHFVAGTAARCVSCLVGVNFKAAAYYYTPLRELIYVHLEQEGKEVWGGEIEVDESCFGGTRKGKRGRGAVGKVPVFSLLKGGGKVYTQIIPDRKDKTLMPLIEGKFIPDSIVYSDS